ncbi:hypothetical protein QBC36DRAFT_106343 [Triangularia setosa]|uniref:Uncharacterized protein n=1 Tax=Triangularia setosa TaxID=2587417 RepID=A0AAN6VZK4_9PEZI|nr:hypothetical protein QBC36DRAFT_106343 [Podospora setosa]
MPYPMRHLLRLFSISSALVTALSVLVLPRSFSVSYMASVLLNIKLAKWSTIYVGPCQPAVGLVLAKDHGPLNANFDFPSRPSDTLSVYGCNKDGGRFNKIPYLGSPRTS